MQQAAIIRRDWRSRLRTSTPVLAEEDNRSGRCSRALRLAGASLALLVLLAAPTIRAGAAATVAQPRPPGYLGIEFHDLTNEQAAALHLRGPRGVEVLLVDHDGPAASAGLKPHDLITGLNGHIVASGEALRRMIHDCGAGVEVKLSVFRNGNPITIRTKLANREDVERKAWQRVTQGPPPPQGTLIEGITEFYMTGPAPAPPPAAPRATPTPHTQGFIGNILHGPFTGLEVQAMQPQLADYFGAPKGQGLLVQSVANGSPAASVGIHAGDIILRADNQPMRTSSDWTKHLREGKGKPVNLDMLRDRQPLTLTLQPDAKKH